MQKKKYRKNQDGKDIDSTFFKVNGGDTNIMLSAIVGKNGDGSRNQWQPRAS